MKPMTRLILTLLLSLLLFNCKTNDEKKKLDNELTNNVSEVQLKTEPKIAYIVYGSFCSQCGYNCTELYRHNLIGNTTTFWTDKTDSYFEKDEIEFNTKMNQKSEKISFDFINKIPKSILKATKTKNIYGCPDCTDGCGIYFEYQLDDVNSKPIIYSMDKSLVETNGDVKKLGELIIQTLKELKKYR